ncbi:hypothetical protein RJ639_025029 [Escallonia herrerae]|uniref:Uncharacterized protein n=1 Tax=Escallonia herrerae TaxID=1293975 RepID=A0AA88SR31_9ASTE|nr:hypothetical protein RJ639_025029 [Escallonia herrerae]
MASHAKIIHRHQPLPLHHPRPPFPKPSSLLPLKTPSPSSSSSSSSSSSPSFKTLSIKATTSSSSSNNPILPDPKNPRTHFFETLNTIPQSLLKTTLIAAVTATALFFAKFKLKSAISAPISAPPSAMETETAADNDAVSDEEKEKNLEEYLDSHPDDVQALRSLMELKIKNKKVQEAITTIEQLIRLEPDDIEWPLLKAHMHSYNGDQELAKIGFNEILVKEPLRVEAYHGLVMAASQTDSSEELKEVEKRIGEGMEVCKREKKKEDLRDFKLLLAQIRVIEGDYSDALKIYQQLVKEEPRDFRPYLCQGIIYTLLRKKDEAEKNFQKYRRLVPKGHPYARYFDDNMMATKLFSQKVENERAASPCSFDDLMLANPCDYLVEHYPLRICNMFSLPYRYVRLNPDEVQCNIPLVDVQMKNGLYYYMGKRL